MTHFLRRKKIYNLLEEKPENMVKMVGVNRFNWQIIVFVVFCFVFVAVIRFDRWLINRWVSLQAALLRDTGVPPVNLSVILFYLFKRQK